MARRHWLVLGVGGLILSAASRVTAAGPAQVTPEGYAGSSVGNWTCGPTARANYGGVGGHARFYTDEQPPKTLPPEENADNGGAMKADPDQPAADPELPPSSAHRRELEAELADTPDLEPHGFSIGAGGGAESRSFTRIACANDPCDERDRLPPARILGGGRANIGYDADYFGAHVGALVYQRWENNTDASPTANVLPDVDFRFGRRAGFHGGIGFGAYNVSTIFRPGGYLSVGYGSGRWASDLRVGGNLAFDDAVGGRVDASVRYGISRVVAPGIGLAVSSVKQVSPEGQLFIVITP